jgi:hypothetical protein
MKIFFCQTVCCLESRSEQKTEKFISNFIFCKQTAVSEIDDEGGIANFYEILKNTQKSTKKITAGL